MSKDKINPEVEDTSASHRSTSLDINAVPVSNPHTVKPELAQEAMPIPNANHSETDRASGDFATYLYYFKSAGWASTAIFMVLQLIFGFLQAFPSKSTIPEYV